MQPGLPGVRLVSLDSVDSTSDELVRRVAGGAALPMAVVSRVQTGGRGRRGRVWASPEGGLWMSVGVASDGPIGGALALRLGLAVCGVVDDVVGGRAGGGDEGAVGGEPRARAAVKWPNDVLVDGRKLAGVLCERRVVGDGHVLVVGIGMNVNNDVSASLPGDVASGAIGLASVCGRGVDVSELAAAVLSAVAPVLRSAGAEMDAGEMAGVLDRLHGLDGAIVLRRGDGSALEGELAGIAPDGRLALRTADGMVRLIGEGELVGAAGDARF